MSRRAARRRIERERLDLLAAESYAASEGLDDSAPSAHALAIEDFLAGVEYERRRTRLVWRRQAPDWLKLAAITLVGLALTAGAWLFLILLAALPI